MSFLSTLIVFTFVVFTHKAGAFQCSKTVSATSQEEFTHAAILYLFPQAEVQAYVVGDCANSAKQIFSDNSFQLHEPDTPNHGDDAFPVEDVEEIFNTKWTNFIEKKQQYADGDLDTLSLDPFFDHNFAMYVNDLTQNLDAIQDQSDSGLDYEIPYVILKWSLDEELDDKQDFISLLLYLPNTQIVYELVTAYDEDTFDSYLEDEVVLNTEQRASFKELGFWPWDETYQVQALRQGRAVSDVDVNVQWYEEYVSAELVESGSETLDGVSVEYAFIRLPYAKDFVIGFFKRDDIDDNLITIKEFEDGINSVHQELVKSPNCQYDRWFDNHYAIGYMDYSMTDGHFCDLFDKIIHNSPRQRYIMFKYLAEDADESSKSMFAGEGIDYAWFLNLIEPNGNTIEIIGYCEDDIMLEKSNPFDGYFCNLCTEPPSGIPFPDDWIDNGAEFRTNTEIMITKNENTSMKVYGIFIVISVLICSGIMYKYKNKDYAYQPIN